MIKLRHIRVRLRRKWLVEIVVAILLALSGWWLLHRPVTLDFGDFKQAIALPTPTAEQRAHFNHEQTARWVAIPQGDGTLLKGYRTENQAFYKAVLAPTINQYKDYLLHSSPTEIVNALTLLGYEAFRNYIGPEFYRWGGDLFDLDDPQEDGPRHQAAYGLDCSGFATLPFELAVGLELLKPTAPGMEISSKGFKLYCQRTGFRDTGGRNGGGNHYRLDTAELANMGRVIFSLAQNARPTRRQLRLLQPGDLVGRSGHFGLIVEINHTFYFLESGGWVVPQNGYRPVRADKALAWFAKTGPIEVRRTLPDRP